MKKPFEQIFTDCTKLATKIPQANYLPMGRYPIVDQGQAQIAGYADTAEGLFTDIPAIIFGDHTRIIKYINEPFFIGADGVKVLKTTSDSVDYKYLFYALTNVKIPNTGYNRHFKWLKESIIPLPNLSEQKQIAERLDKVQNLIALQKQQLSKLDELIKSRFIDLFGDPITNEKKWEIKKLKNVGKIITGNTPSKAVPEYYNSNFIEWIKTDNIKKNLLFPTKATEFLSEEGAKRGRIVRSGTLLVACIAGSIDSIGKSCITDRHVSFNQQINAIIPNETTNVLFLYYLVTSMKKVIQEHASNGMKHILIKTVMEDICVPIPPFSLQTQFSDFVTKIEAQKGLLTTRLSHLETLYKSLMQEYFG